MEMTEKMKRSVVECLQKKGLDLSYEQLDEVAGGREMTGRELRSVRENLYPRSDCEPTKRLQLLNLFEQYKAYITSLPECHHEVEFWYTEYYEKMLEEFPDDRKRS